MTYKNSNHSVSILEINPEFLFCIKNMTFVTDGVEEGGELKDFQKSPGSNKIISILGSGRGKYI